MRSKTGCIRFFSPQTYPCSLCALTYDNLGMRHSWRGFTEGLGYAVEFLHRNELAEKYGIEDVPLPAAFTLQDGKLNIWIRSDAMDACKSLNELQALVTEKLVQETG